MEQKIPIELSELFAESCALFDLRDKFAAKLFNGYHKALDCAKKAEKKRQEFWYRIYKLYPECKESKSLVYERNTRKITF